MKSDFDPGSRMHGLHSAVAELDQLAAHLERALVRVAAFASVDNEEAREVSEVRARTESALYRIAIERPRLLAMIANAHGPGPPD